MRIRRRAPRRWGLVCAGIVLEILTADLAYAIPAFARRYQTSCTTCHVLIPKLNAFGVAFRNNGYRIPPYDAPFVKVPDVPLGAPAWKRLWPDAIWPGGIPGLAPIALRIKNDAVVNPSAPVALDFAFPSDLEILAGGTAGDGISYFVELEVLGGDADDGNRVDLSRAFVQFDKMGGTTLANLVVGRFEIRAVPFSRFFRRLTASDFLAMDYRNPADGIHLRRPQAGLEFWGAMSGSGGRGGLEYAAGVVNGTGSGDENNTAKDVYTRLSYKIGGFGVTGSKQEGETARETRNWRDDSLRVGMSTYVGRGAFADGRDDFWRLSTDVDLFLRDLNLFAVAVRGRDHFKDLLRDSDFTAATIEGDYVVKPWIIAILRYDTVARDRAADIRRVVPAVAVAIRANVRVVAEWESYLETSFGGVRSASGDSRARIRLDLVF